MIRVRPAHFVLGIFATLVVAGTAAIAAPKPKIAVLGLELQSTTVDQQDAEVAKSFTTELRSRAREATGPFQLAPGGERELIDEKVMNNCNAEATACMVSIGAAIPADQLMYGKIERDGADAYKITIKLLNVNNKTTSLWGPERLTERAAKSTALAELADKAYDRLVGVSSDGTLVVKSSVDGTVYVNDEPKGEIKSGTLIVSLPENRYRVEVKASGYKTWSQDTVTIRGGQTESVTADLVSLEMGHTKGGIESDDNRHTGLKVGAAVSFGVAAVAGGVLAYYHFSKEGTYEDSGMPAYLKTDGTMKGLDSGDCSTSDSLVGGNQPDWRTSCNALKTERIAAAVAGVGLVAGIVLVVVAKSSHDSEHPGNAQRATKKRRQFAVTPIVSPHGGGATVRFDW